MPTEDERLAFVEQVIARARERWRGVLAPAALERHLAFMRDMLLIHPVAQEYVARAMPRTAPAQTEERAQHAEAAGGGEGEGEKVAPGR